MRLCLAVLCLLLLTGCAAHKPVAPVTQLERDYYGKPYLDAPKGWHWVCEDKYSNPDHWMDSCYIVRDK